MATNRSFHEPALILRILLIGTAVVIAILTLLLAFSYFVRGNTYVLDRLLFGLALFFYLALGYYFQRKQRFKVVAGMLISLYGGLALLTLAARGINTASGILMLCFVIAIAGVTLGARTIIPTALGAIIFLIALQAATSANYLQPDTSSLALPSGFGDIGGYAILLGAFALITWLSGKQMEESLYKARRAEKALEKEKSLLAVRLEERTQALKRSQMEETRQLYRFAELGQLSTLLLHELANNLTVLTLDIEDLEQRHKRSKTITRAKESIGYLETMVDDVRQQIQSGDNPTEFDLQLLIQETIAGLKPKAESAAVEVSYAPLTHEATGYGDPTRLVQVLTVIITNAIDAYSGIDQKPGRAVAVTLKKDAKNYVISVTDWGVGIPTHKRKQLFEPFKTTKSNGMGIGLFVARKMIESHFHGSLSLAKSTKDTTFTITIPTGGNKANESS